MDKVRVIEIKQSVFKNNDEQAEKLRGELKAKGVFLLNLMSSPGSGKTTTLKATINALKDKLKIGVMEADIDSDVDAIKIAETGVKSIKTDEHSDVHWDGKNSAEIDTESKTKIEYNLRSDRSQSPERYCTAPRKSNGTSCICKRQPGRKAERH